MDATTISLIGSAFGGALITGLVALVTHALAGRREHHKWLREEKLKAYADFLTVGRNTEWEIRAHKQGYATREDALKAVRSINHFQSKLLAPERIYSLMDRYHQMLSSCIHVESRDPAVPSDFEPTMNKASQTRQYMSLVMAGDLGVRPDSRMKVWRQEIIDWWYNIR